MNDIASFIFRCMKIININQIFIITDTNFNKSSVLNLFWPVQHIKWPNVRLSNSALALLQVEVR